MKRYLVDLSLDFVAKNGDARNEVSTAIPMELDDDGTHEAAGRKVAERVRKQFRADYGKAGDLNIEVTRIAEIVPRAE